MLPNGGEDRRDGACAVGFEVETAFVSVVDRFDDLGFKEPIRPAPPLLGALSKVSPSSGGRR